MTFVGRGALILALVSMAIAALLNLLMCARYLVVGRRRGIKWAEFVAVLWSGVMQRDIVTLLEAEGVQPTRCDRAMSRVYWGTLFVFVGSVLSLLGMAVANTIAAA